MKNTLSKIFNSKLFWRIAGVTLIAQAFAEQSQNLNQSFVSALLFIAGSTALFIDYHTEE